jgi:hypothetical protein
MKIVRALMVIVLVAVGAMSGAGVLQATGSRYTTIDDPKDAQSTWVTGINAQGDIVGYYSDRDGSVQGFLLRQGRYTSIADPTAIAGDPRHLGYTEALGINAQGISWGSTTPIPAMGSCCATGDRAGHIQRERPVESPWASARGSASPIRAIPLLIPAPGRCPSARFVRLCPRINLQHTYVSPCALS